MDNLLRTRPAIFVGLIFVVAAFVVSFLSLSVQLVIIAVSLAVFVFSLCIKKRAIAILAITILVAAFGYYAKEQFYYLPSQQYADTSAMTEFSIKSSFQNKSGTYGYVCRAHTVNGEKESFSFQLYSTRDLDMRKGDLYKGDVLYSSIGKIPSFDAAEHYKQKGIYLFAFVDEKGTMRLCKAMHNSDYQKIIKDGLDRALSKEAAAMAKALLVGDKTGIDRYTMRSLTRAGIVHITAVSGLHVTIIAGIMMAALSIFRISKKKRNAAVLIAVWTFSLLAGFSLPTVRAAVMISFMLFGGMVHRQSDAINSLFLSALFILLVNPFAIRSLSFLMSFCTTLSILFFASRWSDYLINHMRICSAPLKSVAKSLCVTAAALVGILPINILVYERINLTGLLANVVAVPLMSLILFICVLWVAVFLLLPIPAVLSWVSNLLEVSVRILLRLSEIFAEIPFGNITLDKRWLGAWLASAAVVFLVAIFLKGRNIKSLCAITAACFLIAVVSPKLLYHDAVMIETVTGYDSKLLVVSHRENAVIIVVQGKDNALSGVENSLDRLDVKTIQSVIFLGDNTETVRDIYELARMYPIKAASFSEKDEARRAILKVASGKSDYVKISDKADMRVFREENGFAIARARICGRTVCIVPGESFKTDPESCSILLLTEQSRILQEDFSAKCVILMGEQDGKQIQFGSRVLDVRDKDIRLVLRDGKAVIAEKR